MHKGDLLIGELYVKTYSFCHWELIVKLHPTSVGYAYIYVCIFKYIYIYIYIYINMIHLMAIDISSANIQYSGLNIATQ